MSCEFPLSLFFALAFSKKTPKIPCRFQFKLRSSSLADIAFSLHSEVLTDSRPLKSMIKSSEVVVARPLKFPVAKESNEEVFNENASQVPLVPLQHPSPICDAFLMILITLLYIAPILISKTEITSSPPHLNETRRFPTHKSKVPLQMKQQFSGTCIIKSRQLCLPVHKTKATSLNTAILSSFPCFVSFQR